MEGLLPFFLIIAAGLVFPDIFKRLHLPYVTALILAGILIGPSGLRWVTQIDSTVTFIGAIGVVFLMFIAGTEIKLSSFQAMKEDFLLVALLNGFLPFATGFAIAYFFEYELFTALTLGVVFVSSSVAVIIPSLEANGLIDTKAGKTIITAAVIEDVGSLLMLAFLLQSFTQKTPIPLPLYIIAVGVMVLGLKLMVPRLQQFYYSDKTGKDLFESKVRFVFAVLIASVILFEFLGMHSIIAGFIIGIILSESIEGKLEEKIRTISYGIFIPTFFLIIGMQADLSVFSMQSSLLLPFVIVAGLLASKILSGWYAGKLLDFSKRDCLLIGFSTTPQLSTTLAAAFAALEFGLLTPELATSLIILSIVTTFVAPLAIKILSSRKKGVYRIGVYSIRGD